MQEGCYVQALKCGTLLVSGLQADHQGLQQNFHCSLAPRQQAAANWLHLSLSATWLLLAGTVSIQYEYWNLWHTVGWFRWLYHPLSAPSLASQWDLKTKKNIPQGYLEKHCICVYDTNDSRYIPLQVTLCVCVCWQCYKTVKFSNVFWFKDCHVTFYGQYSFWNIFLWQNTCIRLMQHKTPLKPCAWKTEVLQNWWIHSCLYQYFFLCHSFPIYIYIYIYIYM